MENKRMFFEVDANSIDIKQLLQKDFLELSMRVISDANPNVNGSWFTLESMEKAKDSFANKPILGYFENGDFVSHDGEWNYDSETQMNYWDTLGKKGERILGMIRESDPVQIVEGSDGLNWIELKCCLWVNYSYKQVKRLLKDAKKAKSNGGLAKNVSVEVDITDYDMLPNGVMKIKEFNLIGVTILGSRNGVKVEPGIENAGLSVVDIMGTEVFEAQKQAIRMAYEKLDNPNIEKEENSKMEKEATVLAVNSESQVQAQVTEEPVAEPSTESGEKIIEGSNEIENNQVVENATFESSKSEEKTEDDSDDDDNDSENGEDSENKEDEKKEEDSEKNCKFEEENVENECPGCASETVYDLTYLAQKMSDFVSSIAYTCKYYENYKGDKEAIISTLQRFKRQYAEDIAIVGELVKGATEDLKNSILNFEKSVSEDTFASLYKKYADEKANNKAINEKYSAMIQEIEKTEFLKEAKELLDLSKVDEEYGASMFEACKNGEIANIEVLKNKLALKMFEDAISNNKKAAVENEATEHKEEDVQTFSAPVNTPDTTSVFEEESKKNKKKDSWEIIKDYSKK